MTTIYLETLYTVNFNDLESNIDHILKSTSSECMRIKRSGVRRLPIVLLCKLSIHLMQHAQSEDTCN